MQNKETNVSKKKPSYARIWFGVGSVIIGIPIVLGVLVTANFNRITKIVSDQASIQGVDIAQLSKVVQDAANGSSVSVKIGDIIQGSLPSDFPGEFPIIESAKVISAEKKTTSTLTTFDVVLSVDKVNFDLDKAFQWYISNLGNKQWRVEFTNESSTKKSIEAELQNQTVKLFINNSIFSAQEVLVSIHIEKSI